MVEWLSNTMTFEMETESENSYYVYWQDNSKEWYSTHLHMNYYTT